MYALTSLKSINLVTKDSFLLIGILIRVIVTKVYIFLDSFSFFKTASLLFFCTWIQA